jgi:hypothetical protein
LPWMRRQRRQNLQNQPISSSFLSSTIFGAFSSRLPT